MRFARAQRSPSTLRSTEFAQIFLGMTFYRSPTMVINIEDFLLDGRGRGRGKERETR